MGKYSSKNFNKHHFKRIKESLWREISTEKPPKESELCNQHCPEFISLSKSIRNSNRSFNEGKCKLTGEEVFAGSSLCLRGKESI